MKIGDFHERMDRKAKCVARRSWTVPKVHIVRNGGKAGSLVSPAENRRSARTAEYRIGRDLRIDCPAAKEKGELDRKARDRCEDSTSELNRRAKCPKAKRRENTLFAETRRERQLKRSAENSEDVSLW